MSFNILDAVKGHLTPDLLSKASSFLGEDQSGITKAISGVVPAVLGGMVSKATSGSSGATEVFNMAKDTHAGGLLGNIGNMFGDGGGLLGKGMDLAKGLFGDKLNGIIGSLASFAGIKSSSVSSLFSMAAPLAAGTLGKHAVETNMDAGGLAGLLSSQKSSIMSALPGGLGSLAGSLGLGNLTEGIKDKAAAATGYAEETVRKGGLMKWLPWLLLLLAAFIAWWFLLGGNNGCKGKTTAVAGDTVAIKQADSSGATNVMTAESFKVKLPDGTELNAFKGGIEDKLVSFLGTDWKALGTDSLKKTWFDFDKLNFETGKAVLTAESQAQVNNMAAILKAFPAVKLKIGGYTDKTGNEDNNKKLSGERASAVKAALEKAGVGAQVAGAEGYGSAFAKYGADAPEADRVKDRHVSVSVRE